MRSDQLEALVVISRCQSLSAASEQLHISVQALSASVKSLEQELQLTLLERMSKGVTMTKDGLLVVDVAKRFLSEMYKIQYKQEDPRVLALDQPVAIFTHTKLYELFIPRLICESRQMVPGLQLSVKKHMQQHLLAEAIMQGEMEFAFVFYNTMNKGGYRYQKSLTFVPFFECKLVCLAHSNYPISALKTISLKKLLDYPIAIYSSSDQQQNDMLRMLTNFEQLPNLIMEKDLYMYREMIETGIGIGFSILTPFESYSRSFSEQVKTIVINNDIQLYAGYIVKKNVPLSEVNEVFLRYSKNFLLRTGKPYPSYVF